MRIISLLSIKLAKDGNERDVNWTKDLAFFSLYGYLPVSIIVTLPCGSS